MARPRSNVPTYRKQQSGQARVTINGRDYYLGPHGSKASTQEYDRLVAEYLASGRSGSFGASNDQITMATLMTDYLRFAKRYYGTGKSSELHRIKLAIKPVRELYPTIPAVQFGPEQFKAVRQGMIDHGLSRTGINAHMKRTGAKVQMGRRSRHPSRFDPRCAEVNPKLSSWPYGRPRD